MTDLCTDLARLLLIVPLTAGALACNDTPGVLTGTGTTTETNTSTGEPPDGTTSTGAASSSSGVVDSTSGDGSSGTAAGSESTGEPPVQDMGCPECTVLADELVGGRGLFIDDQWVYWTDQDAGRVERVPKEGGERELIADGQTQPYGVGATGEFAFWTSFTEMGTVQRRPVAGGPIIAVAADAFPRFLQVEGDWIYWCSFDDVLGRVRRVSSIGVGNPPQTLVSVGSGVADLEVVGDTVYFTAHLPPAAMGLAPEGLVYGASSQVPTDELDLQALAVEQAEPWGIAHASGSVFWINGVGDPQDEPRRVQTLPSDAVEGDPTALALQQTAPWGIAADDQYVYWTDYIEVKAIPHGGGDQILLADLQNVARSILVDDDSVYWITRNRVLRRPKP